MDGLKWISSFPDNVAAGIPRASAVLILNDHDTGYPFACWRARSSAPRAPPRPRHWPPTRSPAAGGRPTRVGFVGAGLIARYIHTYLAGTGWSFDEIGVYDLSADSAAGFRDYLQRSGDGGRVTVHDEREGVIRASDLVVFATVAGHPHVHEPSWFDPPPAGAARLAARPRAGDPARPRPTSWTTSSTA